MEKELFRLAGIIVIIISFSLLVYPTPYHYDTIRDVVVKHNWITGKTWIFTGASWVERDE